MDGDIIPLTRKERIRYGIPLKEEPASLLKKSLELVSEQTLNLSSKQCSGVEILDGKRKFSLSIP